MNSSTSDDPIGSSLFLLDLTRNEFSFFLNAQFVASFLRVWRIRLGYLFFLPHCAVTSVVVATLIRRIGLRESAGHPVSVCTSPSSPLPHYIISNLIHFFFSQSPPPIINLAVMNWLLNLAHHSR